MSNQITVLTIINAPVEKVWESFTHPEHIIEWNFATPEWHCPKAEIDLKPGGKFNYRMEAKDGSFGFDFGGTYDEVRQNEKLLYHLDDDRKVEVTFFENNGKTTVTESFDPDKQHPAEMQQQGWQAILENLKKYVESH